SVAVRLSFDRVGCLCLAALSFFFFFLNHTATPDIYPLSLHDALPISRQQAAHDVPEIDVAGGGVDRTGERGKLVGGSTPPPATRSEEHTSELQSLTNLVCRLLLEKKKLLIDCTSAPTDIQSTKYHGLR